MLTYSDLVLLETFEERLEYLQVGGVPAEHTFGIFREANQKFYRSRIWKLVRRDVIARDLGCDLGVPGREILGRVLVHHMNPLRPQDIYYGRDVITDPEGLITVSHPTHLSVHFGSTHQFEYEIERGPGDTKLW